MHISEDQVAKDIQRVSTHRDKNERLSWKRKKDKLELLIAELEPIDDKILDIILHEKYPILDKIETLREEMVKECIHPKDMLVHHGTFLVCKFCEGKIGLAKTDAKE